MSLVRKLQQRLTDPVFYRKWRSRISDGTPRRPVESVELADLPSGKVLVAIAHPDDETFCSGLLCELASQREVIVFCTTRGEGGGTGDLVPLERLGETREKELQSACLQLGIERVEFGGYADPQASEFRLFAPQVETAELCEKLRSYTPSLIITHGSCGEYWHPAHLQLHDAVRSMDVPYLTFNAWNPDHSIPRIVNRHDPADLIFDALVHRAKRLAAVQEHATQAHYFEDIAGSIDALIDATAVESYSFSQ